MKFTSIMRGTMQYAYHIGALLIACALFIMAMESARLQAMHQTALDMAKQLPELRASVALLKGNIESERLYGQTGKAALEEQATAFVLPAKLDQDRVNRLFKRLAESIPKSAVPLQVAKLTFAAGKVRNQRREIPAELTLTGEHADIATFLMILQWSGLFTVRDAVGQHGSEFLKRVQTDAPLSLPAAEELLRTDLLIYASHADQADDQAFQDIPDALKTELKQALLEGGLSAVRSTLRDEAAYLRSQRAWPLPLVCIDDMRFEHRQAVVRLTFFEQATK